MNKSLTLPVEINNRCILFCDKESLIFTEFLFTVLFYDLKKMYISTIFEFVLFLGM